MKEDKKTKLSEEMTRFTYEALFPHIVSIWAEIMDKFRNRPFTYDDLRRIGIWPEEASTALYYLSEQWHKVEVIGPRTFKICSPGSLKEYCPPGIQLIASLAAHTIKIAFKVNDKYQGNLEEASRDYVASTISVFGSLLDTRRKGGPVEVTVYPHDDVAEITFITKKAPVSEAEGFEKWALIKAKLFGTIV